MWHDLRAPVYRVAGNNTTPPLPKGAQIIHIWAGPGTVTLPDGHGGTTSFVIPAGTVWEYDAMHLNFTINGSDAIVFTGAFFVEYAEPLGA